MRTKNLFVPTILIFASILVGTLVLAPILRAQGNSEDAGPPVSPVEVVAPLPLPVEVDGGSVTISSNAPLPVSLPEKDIIRAELDLPNQGQDSFDASAIGWSRPDGTGFIEIPEGHALFVTDIIVSSNDLFGNPTVNEPFDLVFVHLRSDGKGRALDLSGIGLPYSHSFTTPLFFPRLNEEGGKLGITRLSNERLNVILTGYIEPISE